MSKIKNFIMNIINGFCMALADSVPGVSGGTIAFLLGFFDEFVSSLDNLFRGNLEAKKKALSFLFKIGIGWLIGMILSVSLLANSFSNHIYIVSSLFLGFILFAIPIVIKEEKNILKGKYKELFFVLIGIIFVVSITLLSSTNIINVDVTKLNIISGIYVFLVGMIAISAMILPGISGSTLLLIFGLYVPVISSIKKFLELDFSVLPLLIIFGFGVITGMLSFIKLIRKSLENHRSKTIFLIIGMMLGSIFSIIQGPTTLDTPLPALSLNSFNIVSFIVGCITILLLEALKYYFSKERIKE